VLPLRGRAQSLSAPTVTASVVGPGAIFPTELSNHVFASAINVTAEPDLVAELTPEARQADIPVTVPARFREPAMLAEIIIALGSAGALTAAFQVLSSFLTKNSTRVLKITRGDTSLTIGSHTLPEEHELLRLLDLLVATLG
jgi:hypothetical protein